MTMTDKVKQYLKLHPPESGQTGYYRKVAAKFGTSHDYVRKIAKTMGLTGRIGNGYLAAPNTGTIKELDDVTQVIYSLLLKSRKAWTVEGLANHLDVGPNKVRLAIEKLKAEAKNITVEDEGVKLERTLESESAKYTIIDTSDWGEHEYKFGLTADNHLCSRYERLDVLNALFDIWQRQGITVVYQLGNMIEGERHSKFDIHTHGMQPQVEYFVRNWPRREGMVTRFITGDDHEGWYVQDTAIDIGRLIVNTAHDHGRDDLEFLGHMEHNIVLQSKEGQSIMRLIHAGGGSSYATSYAAQKIVESYQGGEKPQILLVGHYHKAEYGYPREVHVVQAGCTKDQDTFLRKNKIGAHVGGWTISFTQDKSGSIHGFTPQWHPFYDKASYGEKAWAYKRP